MFPFVEIAFLNGIIVSAVYSAFVVIFWSLAYVVGCVLIVVMSPKICKGIFAGFCGLGSMIGGALTSATQAAMGMGWVGVATGAFGSGSIGQAASTIFDVPLPGSGGTVAPSPAPTPSGAQPSTDGTAQNPPASKEAILATSTPATGHQSMGAVSQSLAGRSGANRPGGK